MPFARASERPIAMACLRLCNALATSLLALSEYLAMALLRGYKADNADHARRMPWIRNEAAEFALPMTEVSGGPP